MALVALNRKQLLRASKRTGRFSTTAGAEQSAAPFVPDDRTLPVLREAVRHRRGCDLYQNATQAVFRELEIGAQVNKPKVAIMLIGEQPGDQEDRQGRPFVGPAGKLLDRCIEAAEIDHQT